MIVHLDHDGRPRDLPNHGTSNGYQIHRVVANRWQFERRGGRWKVAKRALLPMDGSDAPRSLLRRGLDDMLGTADEEVGGDLE